MRLSTLLSCFLFSAVSAFSQAVVQPTIMVVPFTKEGEDIRTVLEADANKRAVLTSIKEEFDNRGFTTIDFIGKFKAMSNLSAANETNQTDLMSEIINNSSADIYITAEIMLNRRSDGALSTNIILNAYDTGTGQSLANKQASAGPFRTTDVAKLADVAIKKDMDLFLNNMQGKFNDIVANGKSIVINIGVDEGSSMTLSDEVGSDGNMLSDEIELWMEENAYKKNYHIAGSSDKTMQFDDVRIPYDTKINKFAMSLNRFFKSLGLNIKRTTTGNQIHVKIL